MSAVSISAVKSDFFTVEAIVVTHHRTPPPQHLPSLRFPLSLKSPPATSLNIDAGSKLLHFSRRLPSIKCSSSSYTPSLGKTLIFPIISASQFRSKLNFFFSSQIYRRNSLQNLKKHRKMET